MAGKLDEILRVIKEALSPAPQVQPVPVRVRAR